ncbi:MAG: hypothetical protein IPM56_00495 [Ignavibacteriales bacterium]|nr:MAG: hypothetical protein IPM56_00495 [Ignavibacteriales bacterium]
MNLNSFRLLAAVWVVSLFFNPSLSQNDNLQQIKLNAVLVNDQVVPESEWQDLNLTTSDKLTIDYSYEGITGKEIFYKIFLNGIKVEPEKRITAGDISLSNFSEGNQIVRIQAYDLEGWESNAYILKFNVRHTSNVGQTTQMPAVADNTFLIYLLGGICLILAVIVSYLLINRPVKVVKEVTDKKTEYISDKKLEDSLRSLKEINTQLNEENTFLKEKVKELESNVKDLESANLTLLEQKEKFAESKRQLELLQSQKEELFAIAVHDIKNPASAIKSYIDLLNSYDLNATEQQEIMTSLVASSEDIVKLTQQICLVIAKDKPDITLKFTKTSIKKLIEKTYNQNLSYARTKKVMLINKATQNLPEIKLNESKIEEVIDNLLNNAIKFAPPETQVEIKSFIKDNSVVVEVVDNGVGLSQADLTKIFQKGATLSSQPTGLEHSSGLGLWIAKKMVEEHNGKIWVTSHLGKGSAFFFSLPLNEKETE